MLLTCVMIKNKHHIISEIENLAHSYDLEYQSVGNEIKIYLDDTEIFVALNKFIDIYENGLDKPHSFLDLDKAIEKLQELIS